MRLSSLILALFRFLIPPTLIGLAYIYFYPALYQCDFPPARPAEAACRIPGSEKEGRAAETAPFRLLALADPQLEGDSSLPDWRGRGRERWVEAWGDLRSIGLQGGVAGLGKAVTGGLVEDTALLVKGWRKTLDLWGNDLYLAHIYRSVHWWTKPSHVVVLGDLLGSQWIGDEEFERRTARFWEKVFKGAEKVPASITSSSGRAETLGEDQAWNRRIIAVAGNHDVGYAGDINEQRIERFEKAFGDANWEVRFRLEKDSASASKQGSGFGFGSSLFPSLDLQPELRLVVLNSMNLDEPAYRPHLREQSRDFLENSIFDPRPKPNNKTATILLTHIPLHKEAGICVDGPMFSYFPDHQGGGIREQNHLSKDVSKRILDGLSQGGEAIVLDGHDHEGCDTHHFVGGEDWEASQYLPTRSLESAKLREITVRSMMGEFSGNAGLLSAWFDAEEGRWTFAFDQCLFGIQHIWWAGHVLAIIEVSLGLVGVVLREREGRAEGRKQKEL